ncbi:MAG UNVERIFIED_CONTAM: hypothetical protein LVT10_02620 [Anaerolineae bacterium]
MAGEVSSSPATPDVITHSPNRLFPQVLSVCSFPQNIELCREAKRLGYQDLIIWEDIGVIDRHSCEAERPS